MDSFKPFPFFDTLTFRTYRLFGFGLNAGVLAMMAAVHIVVRNASFSGHLGGVIAGVVVGGLERYIVWDMRVLVAAVMAVRLWVKGDKGGGRGEAKETDEASRREMRVLLAAAGAVRALGMWVLGFGRVEAGIMILQIISPYAAVIWRGGKDVNRATSCLGFCCACAVSDFAALGFALGASGIVNGVWGGEGAGALTYAAFMLLKASLDLVILERVGFAVVGWTDGADGISAWLVRALELPKRKFWSRSEIVPFEGSGRLLGGGEGAVI